ncbi:MAG: DUF4350 domain-containing protein [Pirellulaceae bacterium]
MSVAVTNSRVSCTISHGVAWAVALSLLAGWMAAGSLGILAVTLQSTLVWLLLAVAVLCARPKFTARAGVAMGLLLVLMAVLPLTMPSTPLGLTLGVAAAVSWLAIGLTGAERRVVLIAGLSVLVLVLYRITQQSIPAVWMLSDGLGRGLGDFVGTLLSRPLVIGASFAALDVLVVMLVVCVGWSTMLRGSRWAAILAAAIAVLAIHATYLTVLAYTHEIVRALPFVAAPPENNPYVPPPFNWSSIARQLLPWNLPMLAALLQAGLAVVLVRSGTYQPDAARRRSSLSVSRSPARAGAIAIGCLGVMAVIVPGLSTLRSAGSLEGKKILANRHGQLDWDLPQHDRYGIDSAGTYGLLPALVESLGGTLHTTSALSSSELAGTDILMLLQPDTSLAPEQQQRIWQYVHEGGSLLVVTEGFSADGGLERRVDELLDSTAISVHRDAALSQTRDWRGSLRPLEHPATTSASSATTRIVSDQGASLHVGWPARPLLVGLWGWSAPEQEATWSESPEFQEGSQLGDLVLAAEQRVGAGRVIVLGDKTSLTNEGLVDGYCFVGHLLAYLAAPSAGPQLPWRQVMLALSVAALLGLLTYGLSASRLAAVCLVLAISLACCQSWNEERSRVVPDGARVTSLPQSASRNCLAYIDATHLEAYAPHAWGFDALNGLVLNLQRNGYLSLMLQDSYDARLERASLLVSIGPARRFTASERQQIREFVDQGGCLISMVGAEESAASASLLADFGLRVPASPVPTTGDWHEPEPFGRTKADYLEVEEEAQPPYQVAVRLHAAWPVEALDEDAEVLAYGRNILPVVESEAELPVVLMRKAGRGQVLLTGDTAFALNKNLEYIGGEPFFGGHENAHFWRWLLTRLRGEPLWIPPRTPERVETSTDADDLDSFEEES